MLPFLTIQRQRYKIQGPLGTGILYTAGAELSKRAAASSTGGVSKSVSQFGAGGPKWGLYKAIRIASQYQKILTN